VTATMTRLDGPEREEHTWRGRATDDEAREFHEAQQRLFDAASRARQAHCDACGQPLDPATAELSRRHIDCPPPPARCGLCNHELGRAADHFLRRGPGELTECERLRGFTIGGAA
jgi:hypothetical protein